MNGVGNISGYPALDWKARTSNNRSGKADNYYILIKK